MNVVRGENTGSSIDENLSRRPPTTHRKRSLRKISSWMKPPPSLRSSPSGASEMSNVLCLKLPPNVSTFLVPIARTSDASTSKVLVSKERGSGCPESPRARRFDALPSSKFVKKEMRSEEHTSELQSRLHLVCRLLLEKKKTKKKKT